MIFRKMLKEAEEQCENSIAGKDVWFMLEGKIHTSKVREVDGFTIF